MSLTNLNVSAVIVGSALIFIILSIPLFKGRVRMNRLYGVRFREAFASDEDWYAVNRYGALQLIFWSFILIGLGIVALLVPIEGNKTLAILFILSPAFAAIVSGIITYAYARSRVES